MFKQQKIDSCSPALPEVTENSPQRCSAHVLLSPPFECTCTQAATSKFMTQCIYIFQVQTQNFNQIQAIKSSLTFVDTHMEAAVTFWTCENLFPPIDGLLCGLRDWQIKLKKKKDLEKSALPTMKGSIMALNPCTGNMSDSSIQVDPSLRSNTCSCRAMCSLCTCGNSEVWGNVYHGSVVPRCTEALEKYSDISSHHHHHHHTLIMQ